MKKQLSLITFILISITLLSQSVPRAFEEWRTTAGTQNFYYKNVLKTNGTDSYVAGATMNSSGNLDVLIAKYNAAGNLLWMQQYNGAANSTDFAADIYISSSYVYVTGAVCNNTTTPESDILYMKLNKSTGSVVFNNSFNGAAGSIDVGKSITVDAANSYLFITGSSYNSSFNSDMVTLKYDPSGTLLYTKIYNYSANLDDAGFFMKTTTNRVDVIGAVQSSASGYKVATLSYSVSTGATIATSIGTVVTTTSLNTVQDFTNDGAGNYLLAGGQDVSGQGSNIYIQKFGSTSLLSLWTYTFNSASNADDIANAIKVDASNNVYIAGSITNTVSGTGKDIKLIKLNSSGVVQWSVTSTFNGDDEIKDMTVDASNNFYLTGYRQSTTAGASDKNYYTAKYNSSGTKIWEIETDNVGGDDIATNIALDSLNNVIISGQSKNSAGAITYLTVKYVQGDITNPVDLNGEASNKNIGFFPNRGQIRDENVVSTTTPLYYTFNQNPEIFIQSGKYNYVFAATDSIIASKDSLEKIVVSFSLSTSGKKPYGYDPKTYPLNYFLGDVGEPMVNVRGNDRVVTQNLYPQIDLHYYSNANGFKYYFVVKEGGDPRNIKLNIDGATTTTITSNNLFIDGVLGDVTLKRPYAYMVNGAGVTTTLSASSYANMGSNTYSLTTPSYTASQLLVIVIETVPVNTTASTQANLGYSTYYGGSLQDYFLDIKVKSNGDRAVTGYSYGGTFPTPNGLYTTFNSGNVFDAVLLKYTADDSLRWVTFYGGNNGDYGNSVAWTSGGDIFIGGQTFSTDLSMTGNPNETNQTSNGYFANTGLGFKSDGFLAKFTSNGLSKPYSRYVGGQKSDWINAIHIDAGDNLYITGTTSSPDFPDVNANKGSLGSSSNTDHFDAIVGKFSSAQVAVWLTYFGGNGNGVPTTSTVEYGMDIVTDNSGNVFIVGETDENDSWPATNPSPGNPNVLYDNSNNGYADGFIARFTSNGTPDYATFVGGNSSDRIRRLVYKPNTGDLYFAGNASSLTGFPWKTKVGAYNSQRKIGGAAFLGYINNNLEHQWISYYGKGTTKYFNVLGLNVDNTGIVYLSGNTNSDSLVKASGTGVYIDSTQATGDGFVAIFDANKQVLHDHLFGGSSVDAINNSDLYGDFDLFVVGNTSSPNPTFPIAYTSTNASLIDSTFNSSYDGFISRFTLYPYNYVGVKENGMVSNDIIIFPNPANNFVTLRVKELKEKMTLRVYNTIGQIILEDEVTSNEKNIDCNKWSTGMYIFVLSNKTTNSSFKIIKE